MLLEPTIKAACLNEESTKQFLVLPVIGALGYDYTDPNEVQPEYPADFRGGVQDRVDYVIMSDGAPLIAVECKRVGTDLSANRGQLRAYFTALQSVRLGLLTDGLRFEFFVDCENANIMDPEPFVTLDLEAAARAPIPNDVLDALFMLSRSNFQPYAVAEAAEMRVVAKRVRTSLMQEIREPSDELCRLVLQRIGLKNIRRASIQSRYGGLIRAAFEEALVLPVLERLRAPTQETTEDPSEGGTMQRIITTDRELSLYRYVCQRLAFLSPDERHFLAIKQVQYRDFIGKFAVYYGNVRKGRLFDFVECGDGCNRFVFPEPFGEFSTNTMTDIDEPLRKIFIQRVRELGVSGTVEERELQRA